MDALHNHEVVNHMEQYVNGNVHTNGIENFWSCLKRTINGTYVSVEPFHLFRYLDEQAFRYNNRKPMDDGDRFSYFVRKIVGKGLMYKGIDGKDGRSFGTGALIEREAPKVGLMVIPYLGLRKRREARKA